MGPPIILSKTQIDYTLIYISLSPLKYIFFISIHQTRTADIPKDAEFQVKQKCHL